MESGYFSKKAFFTVLIFCKSIGFIVERSLKKGFNFKGIVSFYQLEYHSFVFLIANDQEDIILADQDILNFWKLLAIGYVNVKSVINIHSVLIGTFLCIVLSFFETYHNQVVLLKLSYKSFLALQWVSSDFFALIKFNDVLSIIFQGEQNISWSFGFHYLDLALHDSSLFNQILKPKKWFFVAEVNINLVSMFCTDHIFYLFLFDYFCWQLVIVLKQVFRLVN